MKSDSGDGRRLAPETRTGPDPHWFKHHAIGLVALLIGLVGFTIVAVNQTEFWAQPDLRIATPFLVAAVAAGAVSMARREGAVYLPLLGIGLAAAAMMLGFVIVFGAVVLGTAIVIVILHGVM
jgi:hypothetical protein